MMDKIAILMSTYNGEKYIRKQLDSIVHQTVANNIHLYIRDDESSDSTIRIINEYKDRIKLTLFTGKNVGPAHSFWQLFMNPDIQAKYYAFCDQDDVWDTDKLEKGVLELSKNIDKPALWCSNCRLIDEKGGIILQSMNNEVPQFEISAQFVCGTTQGCAMMFNDELRKLVLYKGYSGNPMHDFIMMTNAIIYGTIFYDCVPSFGYRVHSNNVVEKAGKSLFLRIRGTLNRWFSKKHIFEISKYAYELLKENKDSMRSSDIFFLDNIIHCKNSIKSRIWLVSNSRDKSGNKDAVRSFRIRALLGIL